MFQPTHDADAASILFNLPGYRVLCVVRGEGSREVLVETVADEGACPDCGVLSSRVQARPVQQDSRHRGGVSRACRGLICCFVSFWVDFPAKAYDN